MPDPTLSVQDMKDYGYAWAGVLPAGRRGRAEKALEKGCEVYRLYSDNTEACAWMPRRLPIMRQRRNARYQQRKLDGSS